MHVTASIGTSSEVHANVVGLLVGALVVVVFVAVVWLLLAVVIHLWPIALAVLLSLVATISIVSVLVNTTVSHVLLIRVSIWLLVWIESSSRVCRILSACLIVLPLPIPLRHGIPLRHWHVPVRRVQVVEVLTVFHGPPPTSSAVIWVSTILPHLDTLLVIIVHVVSPG